MALQCDSENNNLYISIGYDMHACDCGCFMPRYDEDGLAILVAVNIMERRDIIELMMRKKPPNAVKENTDQMILVFAGQ